MAYKLILTSVLVTFMLLKNSYGQRSEKFFRKDYHYLDGPKSFYKIHKYFTNWMEAKKICKLEGASMFYPENEDESNAVIEFWNKTEYQNNFDWIYVGISSRFAKNTFTTIEGRPLNDFELKWNPWEPNNATGFDDCVLFYKLSKMIYDDICTKKLPFICKKTLASLNWNEKCAGPENGYKHNDSLGKCYKFHGTPMNWTEAYAVCHHEQSYLAIADSPVEADYFTTFEDKEISPAPGINGLPLNEDLWLGFQNIDGEGWTTIKDGPVKELGNERPGTWLRRRCERGCGLISHGLLSYSVCSENLPFICELDINYK